jgi:uncharacterized heparinase superfamily protein
VILCVTDHEHRSRAIADDVLRGRFTVAGEPRALGRDPDWLHAELPEDDEWRIEWVKFAWGLDLAHAAEQTGDPAYRAAWERLTASHAAQVAPDADPAEVTARRILNWIYAAQRFGAGTPHGTGAAQRFGTRAGDHVARSLTAQVEHVRANLAPERNHRTLELYALFVAGLALGRRPLAEEALELLGENLAADFRPDGVHREASTHYHAIALRSLAGARENARRHGLALPDGFEERLARAARFLRHCTRPDGTIPALSDADTGDYGALLELLGDLLDQDEPPGASFADGGYHVQRSGWDPGARYLIFDCGPLGDGGHGHYDLLSFEAHAGGRALVLDPGRGSYSEGPPNLRRWFRSTAAHNTVTVDGLDQTPYTRGRPSGAIAQGRLLHRDAMTLVAEARSPVYDAVHTRSITRDPRGWVIADVLRAPTEHDYDLRFHLPPGGDPDIRVDGAASVEQERGRIAPSYGVLLDAPVISARATGSDVTFRTVLRA